MRPDVTSNMQPRITDHVKTGRLADKGGQPGISQYSGFCSRNVGPLSEWSRWLPVQYSQFMVQAKTVDEGATFFTRISEHTVL